MTKERYEELWEKEATFTEEELAEGWHWCPEWDMLQVGPETNEWGEDKKTCYCGHKNPKVAENQQPT